jgi:hypothetical protein
MEAILKQKKIIKKIFFIFPPNFSIIKDVPDQGLPSNDDQTTFQQAQPKQSYIKAGELIK